MEPGPDFAQLFQTFEHTAFRLETRDQYNSPREGEAYRKFLAGEPDASYHEGWLSMVRQSTAEGRLFSRVRVVSFPLTDYTRFGIWVSGFTSEAGDDIRYLARDQADDAGLPKHDFWLFDSRKLVMMHFGDDDRFEAAEVIEDPLAVVEHNYWRDAARHHAVPRDDFVAQV
ncbi:MAG: DUF6879 family protein [Labedaea sp.]